MQGCNCALLSMKVHECTNIEIRQNVSVHDNEGVVNCGVACGKSDCSRGIHGIRFDGVTKRNTSTHAIWKCCQKRLRLESECQNNLGDISSTERSDDVLEQWHVCNWQQRLWRCVRQRPQSGTKTTDQDNRLHYPFVVVVAPAIVVVVAPAIVVVVTPP